MKKKMGFCIWIFGCLTSGHALQVINTDKTIDVGLEFKIGEGAQGLVQHDSLKKGTTATLTTTLNGESTLKRIQDQIKFASDHRGQPVTLQIGVWPLEPSPGIPPFFCSNLYTLEPHMQASTIDQMKFSIDVKKRTITTSEGSVISCDRAF